MRQSRAMDRAFPKCERLLSGGFAASPLALSPASRLRRRWLQHWGGVAWMVWALPGHAAEAEPAPIATRLEWGGSVCADAAAFASRVARRTERVRFVDGREELTARLSIAPSSGGLRARVVLRAGGRELVARSIVSPDCDDALDALALVLAISLDAHWQERARAAAESPPARAREARTPRRRGPAPTSNAAARAGNPAERAPAKQSVAAAPAVPAAPAAGRSPGAPESQVPANRQSEAEGERGAPHAPQRPTSAASSSAPLPEPSRVRLPELDRRGLEASSEEPSPNGFHFASGVAADLAGGVAPEPMIGASGWVRARYSRPSVWSPAITVSFSHLELNGFASGQGRADFALNAATLALCPLRIGTPDLQLAPCVTGSVGRLRARGRAPFFPEERTTWWGTLGLGLEGWMRVGVLELRVMAALGAPLARDAYRFGRPCIEARCPDDAFHDLGELTRAVALGAGLGF